MKSKTLLSMLVLLALLGSVSIVLSTEHNGASPKQTKKQQKDTSITSDSVASQASKLLDFKLQSPANLEVPIKLACGETKNVWTTPNEIPAFVFAAITSKEGSQMSVYTRTCNACPSMFAGEAHQDGVIVFGKFAEIEVRCENSQAC